MQLCFKDEGVTLSVWEGGGEGEGERTHNYSNLRVEGARRFQSHSKPYREHKASLSYRRLCLREKEKNQWEKKKRRRNQCTGTYKLQLRASDLFYLCGIWHHLGPEEGFIISGPTQSCWIQISVLKGCKLWWGGQSLMFSTDQETPSKMPWWFLWSMDKYLTTVALPTIFEGRHKQLCKNINWKLS